MAIAILLIVLGSHQFLPSECLTVDICSEGVPHINDGKVNISSPGYPDTHEIPRNGLRCSCFVRTKPNSIDSLEISPIEVSYRGCAAGQQSHCDTSCWSSLDFWSSSHNGERAVCLPRSNFTTKFTLHSTAFTNVTYAANGKNSEFTYSGKFLFTISARRAESLQISCHSGLTTTSRLSTSIPSTTSTTRRKSRTTRISTSTLSTNSRSTASGTPTRSTDSTSTTASSMSSSVDRESTTISSTVTASTTVVVVSTTATTTMMPDTSTIVGETTTTSTVTDRSATVSDAATSTATETVTDAGATSTAPADRSTAVTVSRASSTASETTESTTDDTQPSMAPEVSSFGTDTSTGLTDSQSPTTRGPFRSTSADRSTVVSLDFHSTAVHISSEYPKHSPSETNWYEDSTTAETSTATPVPSRKLIMLAVMLAILLLVLLLIVIIICCVRKSRRKVKMGYASGLYTVKMSDLESDIQSPDVQPIVILSRGGQRSCPLPLHLLLQKTESKKNRGAADYDKPLCCSYRRQTSDAGYAPMGSNTPGSASNRTALVGTNVYADLEHGTTAAAAAARNPTITITDTDAEYYNRPRSASQLSDVHAYETCYSPDGATALSASSEYEHTYAAIQGRKGSIDSLKTESPYSVINEDRLYSNIGDGQNDETDRDTKRDKNQ